MARGLGTRLWDEMKGDAHAAFKPGKARTRTLRYFLSEMRKPGAKPKKIHLVGHSTGGVLLAHLLHALRAEPMEISSCTLLAPACSTELYNERYLPALKGETNLELLGLDVLSLDDRLE